MGTMMNSASELRTYLETILENRIPRALTPPRRSVPEMIQTNIQAIDSLTEGVPLGCLTEICGPMSSGRSSVLMALLAESMRRDEICALIDASDAFNPQSAASAGVNLARLLWIRCGKSYPRATSSQHPKSQRLLENEIAPSREIQSVHIRRKSSVTGASDPKEYFRVEQALKITDLLLQAGGFGLVILDLADISISAARRIPLTTWFRFRRAVENTRTAFLVVEQQPSAKSCASLVLDFVAQQAAWSEAAETDTLVRTHMDAGGAPVGNNEVAFRVTAQGVAISFDKPRASSFEIPQRWINPRARLLSTTHAHFQIARSRSISSSKKLPVRSFAVPGSVNSVSAPVLQ